MAKLFGLNIAKIINTEVRKAGGVPAGVLTREIPGTRTAGNLTGGTNPTTTTHDFNGFLDPQSQGQRDGSLTRTKGERLVILGDSINPAVVPQTGDVVVFDGIQYRLGENIRADPAKATYTCDIDG